MEKPGIIKRYLDALCIITKKKENILTLIDQMGLLLFQIADGEIVLQYFIGIIDA